MTLSALNRSDYIKNEIKLSNVKFRKNSLLKFRFTRLCKYHKEKVGGADLLRSVKRNLEINIGEHATGTE